MSIMVCSYCVQYQDKKIIQNFFFKFVVFHIFFIIKSILCACAIKSKQETRQLFIRRKIWSCEKTAAKKSLPAKSFFKSFERNFFIKKIFGHRQSGDTAFYVPFFYVL